MPNLNTLDTLIAVVIVLLVLSLIVQSVQEAFKKLLKLKSRQIEESLVDLFENVLGKTKLKLTETRLMEMSRAGVSADVLEKVKTIGMNEIEEQQFRAKLINVIGQPALERQLGDGQQVGELIMLHVERTKNDQCLERSRTSLWPFSPHSSKLASPQAEELFNDVMKGFREIGRVSASSKRMLDSISKEDLMKVLQRVGLSRLLPPSLMRLKEACDIFTSLKEALEKVKETVPALDGEAGVKFAKLRDTLAPLINDLQLFFKGDSFNPDLLLADVLNLRGVKLGEALDLLGAVRQKVDADLATAPDDARKAQLQKAKEGLGDIAQHLAEMNQKLDAALAPLRLKLTEVENWYDTVMQSFEERYNRGMKTIAFAISLIVAFYLNANIFTVYRDIADQPAKRATILQMNDEVTKRYQAAIKSATEPTPASTPAATPTPETPNPASKQQTSPSSANETTSPVLSPKQKNEIEKILKEAREEIDKNAALYDQLGFTSRSQEWEALGKKKWNPAWRCLYMGLGWLLMAALLSVGAPFWNDTLKSLFGVKNLLQRKGEIKNVEQKAGEGQPKS
ncbi:MAG: hypothetical protein KA368_18105 [Acidobacteria bacterium]|nr:hypothetical protein [Acidobacteriota bacterium]